MSGRARERWLTLFFGVALATCPSLSHSQPDDPPAGFVWENLKEIHARVLRPETSFFKPQTQGGQLVYYFSPQAFDKPNGVENGLIFIVVPHAGATTGTSANETATAMQAENAAKYKVLRGWTKKGKPAEPFISYGLIYDYTREMDGAIYTAETLCVVNRETDTLYLLILKSHTAEWRNIEPWGEAIVSSLRLDAKF